MFPTNKIYSRMVFHDPSILLPVPEPVPVEGYQFGVIKYTIGEIPITTDTLVVFVSIDQSGSMDTASSDGTKRMASAKHFTTNLLKFIADLHETHGSNVFVYITGFDDKINPIITGSVNQITHANVDIWCQLIEQKLYPRGSTDFEQILKYTNAQIILIHDEHPEYKIHHLLLTDGQITVGCYDTAILRTYLHPHCNNVFVGFGKDHCSQTLTELATSLTNKNSYLFVDKTEFAARICADVIFAMFYGAVEDPVIRITQGLIFNAESNTWESEIAIGTLCAEKTYTFYIASSAPSYTECLLSGNTRHIARESEDVIDCVETIPDLRSEDGTLDSNTYADCTQNVLTHRTLEVLSKIKNRTSVEYSNLEHQAQLRAEINTMFRIVKDIRVACVDQESDLCLAYKSLEDDLFIAYKTTEMSPNHAVMFCVARETSQTRQYSYNPNDVTVIYPAVRGQTVFDRDDDDLFTGHGVIDSNNTPVRSQTLYGVVRQLTH